MNRDDIERHLRVSMTQRSLANVLIRSLLHALWGQVENKQFILDREDRIGEIASVWRVVVWLSERSSPNWLNHGHLCFWLTKLWRSKSKIIQPFAILCPTYRKDGLPGLNTALGHTSRVALFNLKQVTEVLEQVIGQYYQIIPRCFFGNLALEQYPLISDTEWTRQLANNWRLLDDERLTIRSDIEIAPTDQIASLLGKIGRSGSSDDKFCDRHSLEAKAIFDRNRAFYVNKLGWSASESDARTENSISTYYVLGQYFSSHLQSPLFLYTANSYEKAIAYNLDNQNPLFIIYPAKDFAGNISPFSSAKSS